MSVDRINYGDSRVYVNNILLTGVSNCDITTERSYEDLVTFGQYDIADRITTSNQTPKASLSWILGESSNDPFFDFQGSGIVSVEKFDIKKRDLVGENIVSGGFLTSYSVNGSVGNFISASAEYEGLGYSFSSTGSLTGVNQTEDSYPAFIPSKITISGDFPEGDLAAFPIQSFNISVPIPRSPLKVIGGLVPDYRIPNLPIEAAVSFSVIKNDITGMDFAPIILEKGEFSFDMRSCNDVGKIYRVANCSLVDISESIGLDGNATIDFNYVSSLSTGSFSFADAETFAGLISSDEFQLLSFDGFSLLPSDL